MYRWQWIPLISFTLAFVATMAVLVIWRRRSLRDERDPPLARSLRRAPGASLREPITTAAWDAAEYAALALFLLPLAFCLFPLRLVWEGDLPEQETIGGFLVLAAALQLWIVARLWRALERARSLATGYDAEVAAGQELDELRHHGYNVFHDVPTGEPGANLDHVLVGPAGVFAVASRGRTATRKANGSWEVTYDGERLIFPGWEETLPLGQAVDQAYWLFEWLAEELGEPVAVRPILVLPGWSVKRTAVSGIPVLAARRIQFYFGRMAPRPEMTEALIERISEHLEERCRVVALVEGKPAPLQQPQVEEAQV